jgi:hypothetical protein
VSVKDYREYADECMGWARTAKSDRERAIFVQMAQTWLQAAAIMEGKEPPPWTSSIARRTEVATGPQDAAF